MAGEGRRTNSGGTLQKSPPGCRHANLAECGWYIHCRENPVESQPGPTCVASVAGSLYLPGMSATVILFYKPYGVLSQFTRGGEWKTLADFGPFPESVYPAGRLDADSEGLLVLTDDTRIKRRITEPRYAHPRTYLAQVERVPDDDALERLRHGVVIEGKKTRDAGVILFSGEPDFPPRPVPIRFRKNVQTAWLELTLTEGRNRQVRKRTAAAGHPTLRLIRTRIGNLSIDGLSPGMWMRLPEEEVRGLLGSNVQTRVPRDLHQGLTRGAHRGGKIAGR